MILKLRIKEFDGTIPNMSMKKLGLQVLFFLTTKMDVNYLLPRVNPVITIDLYKESVYPLEYWKVT